MSATHDPHPVVVVGFDGSPASHLALSRAIQRVGAGGRLYLVHAWQVPAEWRGRGSYQPYLDDALAEAEAVLESARDAHPGLADISWETELIGGPPPRRSPTSPRSAEPTRSSSARRGFGRVRALLGSVAHEVIHHAACPVTVIPERVVDASAAPAEAALATA